MRRRSATAAGNNPRASSRKRCSSDMVAFLCIGAASSKRRAYGRTCNIATTAAKRSKPMPDEKPFSLEEVMIDDLHAVIKAGRTTCVAVVQHYIDRARAYNGVCSVLVTAAGFPVPEAAGAVRAKAPLRFPTETVKALTIFPDLDKYKG